MILKFTGRVEKIQTGSISELYCVELYFQRLVSARLHSTVHSLRSVLYVKNFNLLTVRSCSAVGAPCHCTNIRRNIGASWQNAFFCLLRTPYLLPKNGDITKKLAEDQQSGRIPQPGYEFVLTTAGLIKLF